MTRRPFLLAAITLVLGATACSSDEAPTNLQRVDAVDDGPVRAVVATSEAAPGEAVTVAFENTTAETYTFNGCMRRPERLVDGAWVELMPELRLCADVAYLLGPGTTRSEPVDVPLFVEAGTYRFTFDLWRPNSGTVAQTVASNSFVVR